MSIIVPQLYEFSVKNAERLHKRSNPRQFLILGFPPSPCGNASILEFGYMSPEIKQALIEKGWRFWPKMGVFSTNGGVK